MIFPIYHIKQKILTSVIAPHGITDLLHAVQSNNTQELFTMNAVCALTSFGLSQNDLTNTGLNIFFIGCSVVHFRHDFPPFLKDNHEELQKCLVCLFMTTTFIANHDLFFYYMCLLHVPNHYYFNRHVIAKNYRFNLSFILLFILFLSFIGTKEFAFYPSLYPLYKGVIISHTIYQEIYVHKSLAD